jgi:hypothetical protein
MRGWRAKRLLAKKRSSSITAGVHQRILAIGHVKLEKPIVFERALATIDQDQ